MAWTAAEVRAALELPPGSAGEPAFTGISTDTRRIGPGALFVALRGERFDGHDHLEAAVAAGAIGAVVRRGTPPVTGLRLYEVEDTLRALGWLGRARRRHLKGPVVAVTGTNGKTSTKELLAAALRTRFVTHATLANLNNLVGVPQTMLEAPSDTEAMVIEAGASLPGEIGRYREIIEPTIAVITNVAPGHLEGFGTLEGVLAEKLALVNDVPLAVVGTEPPELAKGARTRARRVITVGLEHAELKPTAVVLDAGARATVTADQLTFTLPLPGRHLAANAMLAWAVAKDLQLDLRAVAMAFERLAVPGGRGEILEADGLTILNDSYNANPLSFRAAIATAQAMRGGRRLVFVAGTMRELGTEAPRLHAEIAADLVRLEPDVLAAVGDFVPALAPHALGLGDRLITAEDVPELGRRLAPVLQGDELVVLKASRGVALERIIPVLTSRPVPGH